MRKSRAARASAIIAAVVSALAGFSIPQSADALSCMRPDLKFSYHQWQKASGNYMIVRGRLSPLEKLPKLPKPLERQQNPKPLKVVKYRFEGVMIHAKGNQPFTAEINVQPKCLGPWCGGYPHPTGQVLFGLEQKDGGYWLQPGPCPGALFTGNMPELEQTARNCMNGVACTPLQGKPKPVPGPSRKLKIQ